jgi:hypothetical protein
MLANNPNNSMFILRPPKDLAVLLSENGPRMKSSFELIKRSTYDLVKFFNVKRPRLFVETRFIASKNSGNQQLLSNEAPSRLDAINRVSTKAEQPTHPQIISASTEG